MDDGTTDQKTVEVRAARLDERQAVCHLIDFAFDAESYGPSLARPCVSVGNSHLDPHDHPDNTRILLVDGEIVSVVHLAEREAYACGTRVPFGCIAMVSTHPDHRQRGYVGRLMADAEGYMRSRGFCYAVLLGRFGIYGGSLGWRWCGEKQAAPGWKYVAPAVALSDAGLCTRPATQDDIGFLSRSYEARCGRRFGPVVRSHEYWRRWSLQCDWEGAYILVCDAGRPVGYFHITPAPEVDEIGWEQEDPRAAARVFLAAASRAARKGSESVSFWLDEPDAVAMAAFGRAFGEIPRTLTDPAGQPVRDGDLGPYSTRDRPDQVGYMAKYLRGGPGILTHVGSTDALLEVMAHYSWTYFSGDTM